MNDNQLAKQIASGNIEAGQSFVREHYTAVFRVLLRMTDHREEAEDLTQQTFVSARKSIGSFNGSSTLRTWLHRIAINEYRQWRRKRRWVGQIFREEPSSDQGVKSFESGYVLAQAMGKLSGKLREAFVLFEVEQLSMNEVAQVLDIPVGTAKARVSYARQQLRTLLEDRIEVKNDELRESTS
ncbi:MAG: RNA polymerase sigma factor [Fimbriimonadaceae bacterium]